jgi:dienelactone hydrolase
MALPKPILALLFLISSTATAQKKPLDHSVYDNWKMPGERLISHNGQYIAYTINPQEGDGELIIQNPTTQYKKQIPRGYGAIFTADSRYLICKIKPFFADTRQAKIKKKRTDEMPKDSMAILVLGEDSLIKLPGIKSLKTPELGAAYVAWIVEKKVLDTATIVRKKTPIDSNALKHNQLVKLADSIIRKSIDSVKGNISPDALAKIINKAAVQIIKSAGDDVALADAEGDASGKDAGAGGDEVVLRFLESGKEKTFNQVTNFLFDKKGNWLLLELAKKSKDSSSKKVVALFDLRKEILDTIFTGFNEAKNYVFDEEGTQLCFVAERDSSEKALTRYYKLWHHIIGKDSAVLLADHFTEGMPMGNAISEHATLRFSKDATRVFFGTAPVAAPKDTTLVDFELARLDVWHYQDEYLQTQQLKNLDADLKKSHTAVWHFALQKLVQLGAEDAERITLVNEGNANWVLAQSTKGNRVAIQWLGQSPTTAYWIDVVTGQRHVIFKQLTAFASPSPGGSYAIWYNEELKNYFAYEIATGQTRNISAAVKTPLYNEENDVPDNANAYGLMGWTDNDEAVLVYDRYNAWQLSPLANGKPRSVFTASARKEKNVYRYINTDSEHRFFTNSKTYLFSIFNETNKTARLFCWNLDSTKNMASIVFNAQSAPGRYAMSKNQEAVLFSTETYQLSPAFRYCSLKPENEITIFNEYGQVSDKGYKASDVLGITNPQQENYNWGTAELYSWKAYTGKNTTGILYKPDNFDPKKKYPLICYFYEKLSDGLYAYQPPSPTPSRLNISFFVSRGYIVLAPDISYTRGHPGLDAYNHIASGARALVKQGFVDSTKIGIQGQSWGGYQVCYLITKTKLFKAAWAGAPVANMTSAYGGIRWESGLNRQFQYEKQQSRIGATLWERQDLYLENSPLFHLPKVQTPLVIMHNDADGAVPWYQGIEMFTGLRRLGKPVWMLNYNGEAHNLIERKNRKDIQIREQQFFDWQLKGELPARWLTDGVPAVNKGKDWGLD